MAILPVTRPQPRRVPSPGAPACSRGAPGALAALVLVLGLQVGAAHAVQDPELAEIRRSALSLLDRLVESGVVSRDKATSLVSSMPQQFPEVPAGAEPAPTGEETPYDLRRAIREEVRAEMRVMMEQVRQSALEEARVAAEQAYAETPKDEEGRRVVRVPYVPEFVREQIREEVRAELRQDVVDDVMRQAKNERWGMPDALPEWIRDIEISGDLRLRAQLDGFDDANLPSSILDVLAINEAGGINPAGPDAFLNTTQDRERARARMRLKLAAQVNNNVDIGVRLSTGNERDPVSTNQTLGNTGNRYQAVFDQAYLRYRFVNPDGFNWLTLQGGRIPNPWLSTDLVWDSDLGFEGLAATFRHNLAGSEDLFALVDRDRTVFATVGAFPLQELEYSADDKWLVGAQLGTDLQFDDQSRLKAGVALYHYENVTGERVRFDELRRLEQMQPEFAQTGNTYFDVRIDPAGENPLERNVFALASEYSLLNFTASYDITRFAPVRVVLSGDYVKNVAYDEAEIEARTGREADDRSAGYQAKLTVGWPIFTKRGNWRVYGGFRRLEGDAVLDAFADSDFHLGGTNAQGWFFGGDYAIDDDLWVSARWLSADEIDGPPFGVDTVQVDVSSQF